MNLKDLRTCIIVVCVSGMLSRICDCDCVCDCDCDCNCNCDCDCDCDCNWDDKVLPCCWRIGCKRDVGNWVWFC